MTENPNALTRMNAMVLFNDLDQMHSRVIRGWDPRRDYRVPLEIEHCPGSGERVSFKFVLEGEAIPSCVACGLQFRAPVGEEDDVDPVPTGLAPPHTRVKT
jgi:hypothetical protein